MQFKKSSSKVQSWTYTAITSFARTSFEEDTSNQLCFGTSHLSLAITEQWPLIFSTYILFKAFIHKNLRACLCVLYLMLWCKFCISYRSRESGSTTGLFLLALAFLMRLLATRVLEPLESLRQRFCVYEQSSLDAQVFIWWACI